MDQLFEKKITAKPDVVIAIIFGYNEQDIIVSTINNALAQGLHVYYVDDFSNDSTKYLVNKYFSDEPRVGYQMMEQEFRDSNNDESWNLKQQLQFKKKLAQTIFSEYPWLLHMDCDEVFECPWASTVAQGLKQVPEFFGKIDCQVRDYFPTNLDSVEWTFDTELLQPMLDVMSILKFYRQRNENLCYFRFLRNSKQLDLDVGHFATSHPNVFFTQKMIMHHFPYRSAELAQKKVAAHRLPRISTVDKEKGIGWHYSLVNQIKLPIDMSKANQEIAIIDGRYTTYYLKRSVEQLIEKSE